MRYIQKFSSFLCSNSLAKALHGPQISQTNPLAVKEVEKLAVFFAGPK